MKLLMIMFFTLVMVGCSTVGRFKVPTGTDLYVHGEKIDNAQHEMYKRSPFSWGTAGGISYELKKADKVVESGTLKSKFRVASIFWPPVALAYWPMGFTAETYDFTKENMLVRPNK